MAVRGGSLLRLRPLHRAGPVAGGLPADRRRGEHLGVAADHAGGVRGVRGDADGVHRGAGRGRDAGGGVRHLRARAADAAARGGGAAGGAGATAEAGGRAVLRAAARGGGGLSNKRRHVFVYLQKRSCTNEPGIEMRDEQAEARERYAAWRTFNAAVLPTTRRKLAHYVVVALPRGLRWGSRDHQVLLFTSLDNGIGTTQ